MTYSAEMSIPQVLSSLGVVSYGLNPIGRSEELPEIALEAITTHVFAAAQHVTHAEHAAGAEEAAQYAGMAWDALANLESARLFRRIDVLTEMQVNSATRGLQARLRCLGEAIISAQPSATS